MGYAGEYHDAETGFIYLRARYYDPAIGRFISEDPIRDGLNWYAYCNNDPINYKDPSGKIPIETIFDFVSLGFSIADIIDDPTDEWAWAGLAGDLVDFIPYVTGVGEGIKAAGVAYKAADFVADTAKVAKVADNATDVVKSGQKVAKEAWGKAASSQVLRSNMEIAGKIAPDFKHAAHHIVAGGAPDANDTRKILSDFDIDINHSANGVFLPTDRSVLNSTYHPSLHTKEYYDAINNMLMGANTKEDAIDILNDIGKQLSEGTFKY